MSDKRITNRKSNDKNMKDNFWNDAAHKGVVLGGLLGLSAVIENMIQLSGNASLYMLLSVEFIAVAVLHYWLLHRAARQRGTLYTAEEGYPFGRAYGYVMAISAVAGAIVGAVQAVVLHLVVGYDRYIERMIATVTDLINGNGGLPASMEGIFSQSLAQLQAAPAPSFLATWWGGLWQSLLFGALFGLVIAGVLSRSPRPFESQGNE